jgi:pSer/pThr/pTyr-binding forkhead associated (FHA) protein
LRSLARSIERPSDSDPAVDLLVLLDAEQPTFWPLQGARVLLGRDPICQVAISDDRVSRQHAELCPSNDGWLLSDLASTKGTFLNDESGHGRSLKDGDILQLGDVGLVFLAGRR